MTFSLRSSLVLALAALWIFGSTPASRADDRDTYSQWREISFRSVEGLRIDFDFRVRQSLGDSRYPGAFTSLSPVVVNLTGMGLHPSDQMRAVVTAKMRRLGGCGNGHRDWRQGYVVDLSRAPEGHYYGDFLKYGFKLNEIGEITGEGVFYFPLVSGSGCDTVVSLGYELSVVVNGNWLRDPISNTTSFNFEPAPEVTGRYR